METVLRIIEWFINLFRPLSSVDVNRILTERAAQKREQLNWSTSIVDLLKVLDMNWSIESRRRLASALGYEGHYTGTAEQNIWLHGKVLEILQRNGGKIPDEFM